MIVIAAMVAFVGRAELLHQTLGFVSGNSFTWIDHFLETCLVNLWIGEVRLIAIARPLECSDFDVSA